MDVIDPIQHPDGMLVVSTGEYGTHFIDCETLENYFTFAIKNRGEYYTQ